jgi:hypothetical protein
MTIGWFSISDTESWLLIVGDTVLGANSATCAVVIGRKADSATIFQAYTNDNFMNKKHTCAINIATKYNSVTSNHNSKGDILSS